MEIPNYKLKEAFESQKEIETSSNVYENPKADPEHACCCSCVSRLSKLVPKVYQDEIIHILKLAGPVMVSQMMVFLISFVSTVFCGHMGKTELAGVALSIAVINITGISIGSGMASACDTLISQTYGSGNLRRVGVILQRGILILLLTCFPCWALLVNTEPILLLVKMSPEVARLSQFYVQIFMPALPAAFMYQLQARYLQNMGIIWPQVITGLIGNILNAIINYVFLFPLDMGVGGSAVANVISQYVLAVSLFVYINCRGLHKTTWGGWSQECLQEWGPFIKLAIPSMLMLCLEWWVFELGGFLAGLISEQELGAQSIVYELATLSYMFPLGFAVAASVRVGNALGAGKVEQAKLTSKVAIVLIVSVFVGATLGISKDYVGYIFIKDRCPVHSMLMAWRSVLCFPQGVTGGIIRGAGKQSIGALCNFVGYYIIGFPIGVSLMFAAHMGIVGLWTGLLFCVAIQAVFFLIFLSKLNWQKASDEVRL
uniref:Multidrug and toxin extrusion protein n=1 Tax=Gadus morhua TaxID=8049 RepID=A0A8C4ZJ76_GADMO